jgi:hypothetical protein
MALQIAVFAITLFLALAALLNWRRRRYEISLRLNRGLRGYVAQPRPLYRETADTYAGENLLSAR